MTNLQMWSFILGVIVPPVVSLVQQEKWSNKVRSFVGVAISIVVGAGTAFFENGESFNGKSTVQAALIVGVASIAAYHGFWKPTGISPAIEKGSSPAPPTA